MGLIRTLDIIVNILMVFWVILVSFTIYIIIREKKKEKAMADNVGCDLGSVVPSRHTNCIPKDQLKKGYVVVDGEVYTVEKLSKDHDLSCEGSMCWCADRRKQCKSIVEYNEKYRGLKEQIAMEDENQSSDKGARISK